MRASGKGVAVAVAIASAWAAAAVADEAKSPQATVIEHNLAAFGADTVVLGNSKVTTDLDWERLRAGLPGARIAPAGVFGTSAQVWYAVLKNRVYGNGYKPHTVLVYGPLANLLAVDLPSEAGRAILAAQLGPDEPVVAGKVFGGAYDEVVRDRLRRMLLPACEDGRTRENDGGPGSPPGPLRPAPPAAPDRTFLPDILGLAHDNGAAALVVRAPLGPSKHSLDDIPADRTAAALAEMAKAGAGWVEIAGFPEAAFGDGIHMDRAGRRRLTRALLDLIARTGGLSASAYPPPAPVVTRRGEVKRTGTPPAIPSTPAGEGCARTIATPLLATLGDAALGAAGVGAVSPLVATQGGTPLRRLEPTGCGGAYEMGPDAFRVGPRPNDQPLGVGLSTDLPLRGPRGEDAWWVYPGTALEIAVTPAGAEDVELVARAFGEGVATLTAGGRTVPVKDGRAKVRATVDRVTVASPADGPWLLVRTLRAGDATLLADPRAEAHVDVLAAPRRFAGPPPAAPALGAPQPGRRDSEVHVPIPEGAVPWEESIFTGAGIGACTPLRLVRADGSPADVNAIVNRTELFVSSRDCSPVAPRLDGVVARLDPDRACAISAEPRWIYPGDTVTFDVPAAALAGLDARLELGGAGVGTGDASAPLRIRARAGDHVILDQTVTLSRFDTAPPTLPVAIPRKAAVVQVELTTPPGAAWLLLTSAELRDARAPAFDWMEAP